MSFFDPPKTEIERLAKEFLEHLEIEMNRSIRTLSSYVTAFSKEVKE